MSGEKPAAPRCMVCGRLRCDHTPYRGHDFEVPAPEPAAREPAATDGAAGERCHICGELGADDKGPLDTPGRPSCWSCYDDNLVERSPSAQLPAAAPKWRCDGCGADLVVPGDLRRDPNFEGILHSPCAAGGCWRRIATALPAPAVGAGEARRWTVDEDWTYEILAGTTCLAKLPRGANLDFREAAHKIVDAHNATVAELEREAEAREELAAKLASAASTAMGILMWGEERDDLGKALAAYLARAGAGVRPEVHHDTRSK